MFAGVLKDAGATSNFLGYHGFPNSICTSVNHEVVHGIPGGVAFGAGDMEFDSHLHGANERARVSALMQAARIYANVIVELCGEDA